MDKLQIVKIGGNVIEDRKALLEFLSDFSNLEGPKILVHGGGKEATQMAKKLGVEVQLIEGRRITDAQNLEIITMLYAGKLNKNIVAQLQALGCNSLGLTGADGNSILADKRPSDPIDFGFVGDLTEVNQSLFKLLLREGISPVCCALSHDGKGQLLNTNADTIAATLAAALSSNYEVCLSFCFEKDGVLSDLNDELSIIKTINEEDYINLKSKGVLHTGMLPKLQNCFMALKNGVKQVRIGSPKMITETVNYTQITN
ncbi:MAG: acetylglutamate kinase [Flavobacteriaceae bacterium]|nr:acetylglutamate kinase [Flavobacteriaceae bacterium]MDG2387424.1 acetylglutamate kinase [Flavobacteriaceae bacterium]